MNPYGNFQSFNAPSSNHHQPFYQQTSTYHQSFSQQINHHNYFNPTNTQNHQYGSSQYNKNGLQQNSSEFIPPPNETWKNTDPKLIEEIKSSSDPKQIQSTGAYADAPEVAKRSYSSNGAPLKIDINNSSVTLPIHVFTEPVLNLPVWTTKGKKSDLVKCQVLSNAKQSPNTADYNLTAKCVYKQAQLGLKLYLQSIEQARNWYFNKITGQHHNIHTQQSTFEYPGHIMEFKQIPEISQDSSDLSCWILKADDGHGSIWCVLQFKDDTNFGSEFKCFIEKGKTALRKWKSEQDDCMRYSSVHLHMINIKATCPSNNDYNCKFTVSTTVGNDLNNLKGGIKMYLDKKYDPLRFKIINISNLKSEVGHYRLGRILKFNGAQIKLKVKFTLDHYEHRTILQKITCPHMVILSTDNPLHCPIYYAMKQDYIYNEENLKHLNEFVHFKDEYGDKAQCKYYDQCKSFRRLEDGDCKTSDLCHIKLFRHPPRRRNIKLSENMNAMVMNKSSKDNKKLYLPTNEDRNIIHKPKYADNIYKNEGSCFLASLLSEVVANCHAYDLCLHCAEDDECKCGDYGIMEIVDEKMNCKDISS